MTERPQSEPILNGSEVLTRHFLQSHHDWVTVLDLDGRLLELSEGGQRLLEIEDIDPYLHSSWVELWSHTDRDAARAAIEAAVAGGCGRFIGSCCTGSDKRTWWDVVLTPLRIPVPAPGKLLAAARDITERRSTEEALRAAHDTFRHLVDHSPFGVLAVDADFRLVRVSAGAQRVFQHVRPLLGRDFAEVLHAVWPDPFASEAIGHFRRTLETGEPYHAPDTVERRHDISAVESYDWKVERVTFPDHRFGVVCHFYDLSDRQRYQAELHRSENRLRLALTAGQMGTWDVDLQGHETMWDAKLRTILGYPEGTVASPDTFYERVHPDDRQRVKDTVRRAIAAASEMEEEFRIVRPDGEVRWLVGKGVVLKDDQGRPSRMVGINYDISQQKRVEKELREREALLQKVLRALPVGVWLQDAGGRIVSGNPAGQAIWAGARYVGPEEFGQYKGWWADSGKVIAADEWAAARAISKGETSLNEEIVIECFDGATKVLLNSATPILDEEGRVTGAIIVNQDITERKQAEQALQERENRLRLALTAGQMGTWDVDLQGRETMWDAKLRTILGYPEGTVASPDTFYERVHPDDRQRVKDTVRRAIAAASEMEEEFRIVRPDGEVRWLVGKGVVLKDDQGRPSRMVGINYDITDRKMAQVRLERFAEELERRVTERTEELVNSQERLRALASELNLAEQRERKRLAAELHDHLQQLLVLGKLKLGQSRRVAHDMRACTGMLTQVDDVLTEALVYPRTLVAELSPPVLRDHGLAVGLKWLGDYMRKHDLSVAVTVPEENGVRLPEEQEVLLFQSVRELLMNSWKHGGTGHAIVTMVRQAGALRITVQDQGKGFQRAAAETSPDLSSKFGLFSVRERMKALGGSLEVTSAPGLGTRCVLELPLSEQGTERTVTPQSLNPPAGESRPMVPQDGQIRILLVDDHEMLRQGLRTVLEAYPDVEVAGEAANGEEAVTLARDMRPEVVVMDINMPTMNGIDATARIKANNPMLRVIGVSVNAGGADHEAMLRAGADALLTKEAAVERLYDAIKRAVRQAESRS